MKKRSFMILAVTASLIMSACGSTTDKGASSTAASVSSSEAAPANGKWIEPDEKQKSAIMEADTMLMLMTETGDEDYNAEDPEFFWKSIHYMIGNNMDLCKAEGPEGNDIFFRVDKDIVQDCAAALFAGCTELKEIPAGMKDVYVDPDDSEKYCMNAGDRGASESRMGLWKDNGDGTYTAVIGLYATDEDDVIINTGTFVFTDNTYSAGDGEPVFPYALKSVEITKLTD